MQKARTANCVLDDAEATLWGNLRRSFVVGKEVHVVVRSVEIRMVENIEGIGFKPQIVALLEYELLGQAGVEAHLERAPKTVPACRCKQGLIVIAAGTVARRNSVGPRSHELRAEISGIEFAKFRRYSRAICAGMGRLLGSYTRQQRHNRVPNIVAGAVVQARNRA